MVADEGDHAVVEFLPARDRGTGFHRRLEVLDLSAVGLERDVEGHLHIDQPAGVGVDDVETGLLRVELVVHHDEQTVRRRLVFGFDAVDVALLRTQLPLGLDDERRVRADADDRNP